MDSLFRVSYSCRIRIIPMLYPLFYVIVKKKIKKKMIVLLCHVCICVQAF